MPDFQAIIKQVKAQLDRATEDLKLWQSSDAVTITDEKGKVINLRSDMIARCQHNIAEIPAVRYRPGKSGRKAKIERMPQSRRAEEGRRYTTAAD